MTDIVIIFLADYLIYLLSTGILLFCLKTKNKNLLLQCVATALLAWSIGFLIKNLFYLPRPFILTGHTPLAGLNLDGSFPSNHTTVAFGLSFPLLWHHKKAGLMAVLVSCLIALGRVLGGVHTLIDVAAGTAISGLVAWAFHHRG
jgi:undecaprenyl-diphosphatase